MNSILNFIIYHGQAIAVVLGNLTVLQLTRKPRPRKPKLKRGNEGDNRG